MRIVETQIYLFLEKSHSQNIGSSQQVEKKYLGMTNYSVLIKQINYLFQSMKDLQTALNILNILVELVSAGKFLFLSD